MFRSCLKPKPGVLDNNHNLSQFWLSSVEYYNDNDTKSHEIIEIDITCYEDAWDMTQSYVVYGFMSSMEFDLYSIFGTCNGPSTESEWLKTYMADHNQINSDFIMEILYT